MKLLFIDDNAALVKSMALHLGNSWQITAAQSGFEGIRLARGRTYDIIVLDLSLPDINGHDVCRKLRKAGVNAYIIVLTRTGETNTKVNLFKSGADDYVTKPCDANEFQARLLALMRRERLYSKEPYLLKVGGLVLDPHKRQVVRDGQTIQLRRKEFDILEYLLRNRGRIVTRSMIMDNVWDDNSEAWNGTVNVHIKCLRDKVDRPFQHRLIRTAYGLGYLIDE